MDRGARAAAKGLLKGIGLEVKGAPHRRAGGRAGGGRCRGCGGGGVGGGFAGVIAVGSWGAVGGRRALGAGVLGGGQRGEVCAGRRGAVGVGGRGAGVGSLCVLGSHGQQRAKEELGGADVTPGEVKSARHCFLFDDTRITHPEHGPPCRGCHTVPADVRLLPRPSPPHLSRPRDTPRYRQQRQFRS